MKKITLEPGCITCGLCAFIAPEVFEVTDVSYVKPSVDFNAHTASIEEAVSACPVNVIKFQDQDSVVDLKKNADIAVHSVAIIDAVSACPVSVTKFQDYVEVGE